MFANLVVRRLLTRKQIAQVKDLDAALAVSRLVGPHWLEVLWEDVDGLCRIEILIDGRIAP